MCYIAPFILIYQCDLCPSTIRATISPLHICRFGHIHDPERASLHETETDIDTHNPNAVCDGTFTQMPDTGTPPCTLTVKSHERCRPCQARLGLEIMPGESEDEQEREMARTLLWSRWLEFIRGSETGRYLSERAAWEEGMSERESGRESGRESER
ncbi:hypothetical protein CLCR_10866 [Cladophialophora carrionii]|uniref:Uncharacterized protein n=1 Tax=Cladophialophora carrionii TaxID=86049 RepID=A0A1C1CYZ0_9EURO|nr:hypothetical protein CLCR_10866 [Cladophialophora carrionii]